MDANTTLQRSDSALLSRASGRDVAGHLRVLKGRGDGEVYAVAPTGTTIGRTAGKRHDGISIADGAMSRSHARIERTVFGWVLVDLGSTNGCFVDGRICAPGGAAELLDGSVIRIADSIAVFRTSPPSDDGRADAPEFPGVSPLAQSVRRRIDALAATTGHVLVCGETGTGKERVARALARPGAPYVALNCANLTRELVRSELFGHAKGAFTGAVEKDGLVDVAGDGTLFLDEIGELAHDVQADLLRFLEDGSYCRVGSTQSRRSQARIVAATNRDLDDAVEGGIFRRDLAARFVRDNAPLALPALRDRREDLVRWIRMFLGEEVAVPATVLTAGALECLLIYDWKSNLRELRGVILSMAREGTPFPHDATALPEKLRTFRAELRGAPSRPTPPPAARESSRIDPPKQQIEEWLARNHGSMRRTAMDLGVDRRRLYRLCEQHGIDPDAYRTAGDDD